MDWPQVTTYKALASAQTHREELIHNLLWTGTDPEKGTPVNGTTIRQSVSIVFIRAVNEEVIV